MCRSQHVDKVTVRTYIACAPRELDDGDDDVVPLQEGVLVLRALRDYEIHRQYREIFRKASRDCALYSAAASSACAPRKPAQPTERPTWLADLVGTDPLAAVEPRARAHEGRVLQAYAPREEGRIVRTSPRPPHIPENQWSTHPEGTRVRFERREHYWIVEARGVYQLVEPGDVEPL